MARAGSAAPFDAMSALTLKHRRFVAEYLKDQNASQAAIRAGYSKKNANVNGPRLLATAGIAEEIEARMRRIEREAEITVELVRKALFTMATADIREAFNADGTLKPIHEIPDPVAKAIAGIEVDDRQGDLKKVRLVDRVKLWELLGKHLGMFKEMHEVSGRDGRALFPKMPPIDFTAITTAELRRAIEGYAHGNGHAGG